MAEITPLANPPITMGELTDVPAAGSPINATWAQEVSNRVRHRFANVADRDTKWPPASAGAGATCITLDTNTVWTSNGVVWGFPPGTVLRSATAIASDVNVGGGLITEDILTVTMTFPVSSTVTVNVAGWYGQGGTDFQVSWQILKLGSGTVLAFRNNLTPVFSWQPVPLVATYTVAPSAEAGFKVRWTKDTGQTWRGASASYLVTAT